MVGELVVGDGQDQNGLDPPTEVDQVHRVLVEAQPWQGLVKVVDGRDARQLPVELVQHQKLPFLQGENNAIENIDFTKNCLCITAICDVDQAISMLGLNRDSVET